ncbi:MAG: DUF488 domain-containing protein, partial [Nitrososphaeraceae archaeon]
QSVSNDFSILVDKLWPCGISEHESNVDLWNKNIAPSNSLRKWFNHDPIKWEEFTREYYKELDSKGQEVIVDILKRIREMKSVTLVYAAKDEKYNNAVALKGYLLKKLEK